MQIAIKKSNYKEEPRKIRKFICKDKSWAKGNE